MKIIFTTGMLMATILMGCSSSDDPPAGSPTPTIESLDVIPKAQTLDVGTTQKYEAWAKYSDGRFVDVSDQVAWTFVNNNGVIAFDQPDRSEARAAVEGNETIIATLGAITTTATESADVTVVNDILTSITVTPVNKELILNVTHQYIATGTYPGGRTQDLTEESDWTSGDNGVTTISEVGLASPVSVGRTTITASYDGQTGTTNVGITDPGKVDAIIIRPEGYDFLVGSRQQFRAYAQFADTSKGEEEVTKDCTWISEDLNLVYPVGFPNAKAGYFESSNVSTGGTNLTCEFSIKLKSTIVVTVLNPTIVRIEISPKIVESLKVGNTRQFTVVAVDPDGNERIVSDHPDHTYTVDDPTYLSISNNPDYNGVARGLAAGQATITSTFTFAGEAFKDNTMVTVVD
ncbi:MAG: hypothetical protein ACC707_14950 [Thiohalomonadales bacterium]